VPHLQEIYLAPDSSIPVPGQKAVDGGIGQSDRGPGFAGRSPDGAEWVLDTVSNAGTHLIGAATYAMWAGFWPGAAGPSAQPMNEIPKVVFSDSLASAEWGPAAIARGDLAAAVTRLKQERPDGYLVCGSRGRWSRLA
jgi:hypothetical protein